MKSLFRCPVCGGPLDREERVYRCADRHSYDIAKEGYTYGQHHPKVRFDDSILYRGTAAYTYMALRWLADHQ